MAELPLAGRRIVVTRPREQSEPLAGALERLGAAVAIVPLVDIAPVEDTAELEAAGAALSSYDWVVFTSANGVRAFGLRLAAATAPRVAVVGPATADAVRRQGVEPAVVGDGIAADVAVRIDVTGGSRVLVPQADIAGQDLAEALRARGASVDQVTAYRTLPHAPSRAERKELHAADTIVLASGSAARSLAAQGGAGDALVVCIGSKTAAVAREVGLRVGLVADEATADGIIRALVEHFGES